MSAKKVILGVDPGSNITGYGIIITSGKNVELVTLGHIAMEKFDEHYDKLARIFHRVTELIREYKPHEIAVEAPFYGKNAQSMLKLGRAQGMAIAAALQHHIPVYEYSAKKVKQSVTGNGNASKEQVAAMLPHILNASDLPDQLDATDGLAVAVCHHFQANSPLASAGGKKNSWAAFIKENPGRVR